MIKNTLLKAAALILSVLLLLCSFVGCDQDEPKDKKSDSSSSTISDKISLGTEKQDGKDTASTVIPSVSQPSSDTPSSGSPVSSAGSSSTGSSVRPQETVTGSSALKISTVADLQQFAKNVANGNTYSGKTVTLEKDLNLSGINWTPIGTYEKPFKGNFDGNGHTISNMTIEKKNIDTFSTDMITVGLFGFVFDGKITNLNLKNIDLRVENISGYGYVDVGGVVGAVVGNHTDVAVENCSVSGKMDIRTSEDTPIEVGGIVGTLNSNYDGIGLDMRYLESRVDIYADGGSVSCGGIVGNLGGVSGARGDKIHDLVYIGILSRNKKIPHYAMGGISGVLHLKSPTEFKNCFVKLTLPQIDEYSHSSFHHEGLVVGQETVDCPQITLKNVYASAYFEEKEGTQEFVAKHYTEPALEKCERTTALPKNSGFDQNKWNLSDLASPKLK